VEWVLMKWGNRVGQMTRTSEGCEDRGMRGVFWHFTEQCELQRLQTGANIIRRLTNGWSWMTGQQFVAASMNERTVVPGGILISLLSYSNETICRGSNPLGWCQQRRKLQPPLEIQNASWSGSLAVVWQIALAKGTFLLAPFSWKFGN
jgi:hypothetical protein